MHFANPQEARDFLAQHPEVRLIELMLIDANGIPRGKLLHRDELLAIYENGRPLPSSILSLTIQGEDVEASGLVWEVADADCWTYPLPDSLTLQTWRATPTGQVQVSMHPTQGLPATPGDPRHVLVGAIEALKADGYHPVMAVELEFYLLDKQRDANGRPQPAVQMNGVRPQAPQVYGVYELEQMQPFLDDLYALQGREGLAFVRRQGPQSRAFRRVDDTPDQGAGGVEVHGERGADLGAVGRREARGLAGRATGGQEREREEQVG